MISPESKAQVSSWGLEVLSGFSSLPAYATKTTMSEVMFVKPPTQCPTQTVAQERDAVSPSYQQLPAVIFPTTSLFFPPVSLTLEGSTPAGCCCFTPLFTALHSLQDLHHPHAFFHQAKSSAFWRLALPFVSSTPWVCHELFHFLNLICIVSSAQSPRLDMLFLSMSTYVYLWLGP